MSGAEQIREHYDSLAFVYRAFWGDHIHHGLFFDHEPPEQAQLQLLDYSVELLQLRGGETVLDVGCGYGGTLLYLARRFGCRGVGITISPKQAQIARASTRQAQLDDRLDFIVEDVGDFPFPEAGFDIVWATTRGGPLHSSDTMATYMYDFGFQRSQSVDHADSIMTVDQLPHRHCRVRRSKAAGILAS